jgi:hypothetical protein
MAFMGTPGNQRRNAAVVMPDLTAGYNLIRFKDLQRWTDAQREKQRASRTKIHRINIPTSA